MLSLSPDLLLLRWLPALLVLALITPAPLHADELILAPSISLREEYNDNVFAVTSGRQSDYITTVSPSLSVSQRTENAKGFLSGGVNSLHYLQDTKGSAAGYFLKGAGNYSPTGRFSFFTDLGFARDSNASSIDPVTSLVVSSRTEHQDYRLGGKYQISELASASLDFNFGRDRYDSPAYLDTSRYQGSATINYRPGSLSPGTFLAPQLTFRRDSTDLSQVDNLSATLGVSKELNELWALSLSAGGRFTRSEFRPSRTSGWVTGDDRGALGGLSLTYSGERLSGTVALSHALTSASGRSGATQLTGGRLSLSEKFTSELSGSLTAGYAWNRSGLNQFSGEKVDERSRNLSGSLYYRIFDAPRDLSLEARYSYHNTQYRLSGTEMVQNSVMLLLNWQHDMFR